MIVVGMTRRGQIITGLHLWNLESIGIVDANGEERKIIKDDS